MAFSIEHTVLIHKSIEEVFEFHANLMNHVDWHDHIISVDATTDIVEGIGATFRVVNKVGWMTSTDIREIVTYDEPRSYTYQITTNAMIGTSQQILKPVDAGTQFTVKGNFQTKGIIRLFENMIAKRLNDHMGEAVLELKHYLENQH